MAKKKEVKTAIVGLGKVGSTFLKKLHGDTNKYAFTPALKILAREVTGY
ncbi:MAG: hypothetical protein HY265_02485 [Deltaproteobacteria bacterium]|nr:hypothetical protein [Deltaproteobacteria bacterium]